MSRSEVSAAAVLLLLLTVVGCDFLQSSGAEGVSPFITNLRISRSSVSCGRDFVISFNYEDQQNDIVTMRVTFQHETGATFEQEVIWESGGGLLEGEDEELLPFTGSLDLSVPGQAFFTTSFECDTGRSTGSYLVTVQLFDDNGHESNTRSGNISLTTS